MSTDTTTAATIEEMNKAIAAFMDATYGEFEFPTGLKIPTIRIPIYGEFQEYREEDNSEPTFGLKFHSSWDWLMPVLQKLSDSASIELVKYKIEIRHFDGEKDTNVKKVLQSNLDIGGVHEAVYEVISQIT